MDNIKNVVITMNALFASKEEILQNENTLKEEIERCYFNLAIANNNFFAKHLAYTSNLRSEISSLKTHKINPYIAGGAAQGIAGSGLGLYTALKADERNKNIDEWREEAREKVNVSKSELKDCIKECEDKISKLMEIINSDDALKKIYNTNFALETDKINEKNKKRSFKDKFVDAFWLSLFITIIFSIYMCTQIGIFGLALSLAVMPLMIISFMFFDKS